MKVKSARFLEDGTILAVIDGAEIFVPDTTTNRHRKILEAWEEKGNKIQPFNQVATEEMVRAESARRLVAAFGARDLDHFKTLQTEAMQESIVLLDLGRDNWSPDQQARYAQLVAARQLVEAITGASSELRSGKIPKDFANDKHWPSMPGA